MLKFNSLDDVEALEREIIDTSPPPLLLLLLLLLLPQLLMMMALPDEVLGNHPTFELEFDNVVLSQCRYAQIVDVPLLSSDCKFTVLFLNIRSCRKNFIDFTSQFHDHLCNYFCISLVETWLTDDFDTLFSISGFNFC